MATTARRRPSRPSRPAAPPAPPRGRLRGRSEMIERSARCLRARREPTATAFPASRAASTDARRLRDGHAPVPPRAHDPNLRSLPSRPQAPVRGARRTSSDKDVAAAHSARVPRLFDLDQHRRRKGRGAPLPAALRGPTIVVEYGGAAMTNEGLKNRVIGRTSSLLSTVGIRPSSSTAAAPRSTSGSPRWASSPLQEGSCESQTRKPWRLWRWCWWAR